MTIYDLRGTEVVVGDTIAYAATDGRSDGLRVGKIVKITPAYEKEQYGVMMKKNTRLSVSVDYSSSIYRRAQGVNTSIDASLKRFVKVNV